MAKLFQIEEPDGSAPDASAPGAAVGIALRRGAASSVIGAIAFAVGGNAEILPGADGARTLDAADIAALLPALRGRAEKQIARPVTHAVVALPPIEEALLTLAAEAAGIVVLNTVDLGTAPLESAALEAAAMAEDMAPKDQS